MRARHFPWAGPEVAQPWKFHWLAVVVSSRVQSLFSAAGSALELAWRKNSASWPSMRAEEDAEGFSVGAKDEQQRCAVDAIENGRLFGESFPGIGAGGAVDGESDDDVARLQFGAGKADDDGELGDVGLPVAVVFFRVFGDRREHLARGGFGSPLAEGELVAEDEVERCALQRAVDGLASDLLPPGSGFPVAHEEVLVVDAGRGKNARLVR